MNPNPKTSTSQPSEPNHSPPVELPSSNARSFFEEARTTSDEKKELERRFMKFAILVDND